ncbi:hypothetical protein FS837_010214 [Tulasnella sp. UAMH 9824]|nr:hypothetical protein FS837_010214 [Tulasnella sp. UAMH 9824]
MSNVDWNHRLRLCSRCGNAGVILIAGSKARKAFPDILDVEMLLDLLPYSNSGSSRVETYYRMKDIEDIGAEWATMRERSEAEIQEFKSRKVSEAEEIMAHGTLCKIWDRDCKILKGKQRNEVKEARRNELFSRLEALGHHPEDVRDPQITNHASFNTSAALTEKRWETIRPALEALVEDIKTQRLQRERLQIIDQRQALAESLLKVYQVPSDIPRAFQKPLEEFLFWPSFSFVIHQPNEVSVNAFDFQLALDELPDLLAHAAKEIRADLLRRMIDGGATNVDPSSIGLGFDKIRPESDLDEIQLATSTFFCRSEYNGLPFCGKDDLGTHSCYVVSGVKHHCLYYDRRASNVVAALLAMANLDPNTTVKQMDEMDMRFYRPGWPKPTAPLALNWRDAVRVYKLSLKC